MMGGDGILRYQGWLCVPNVDGLRKRVMAEAHEAYLAIHPDSTKIYHDLREFYRWSNMKHDVARHVAKCMVCRQIKVEHLTAGGLYQEILLLE